MKKKSIKSILLERDILGKLNHPLIVNMRFAFHDRNHLYLGLDYLRGGDLRRQMALKGRFQEHEVKFFAACIIGGLAEIHSNMIIHRDLKPENLMLDDGGYLKITDFGISRYAKSNNANETSGTLGYMSPEVIFSKNHTFQTDHYALGVICYELLFGKRPYKGANRHELRDSILSKQARISSRMIELTGISVECSNFINGLLLRKPKHRLGVSGTGELARHPWLCSIDWAQLLNLSIEPPYIPKLGKSKHELIALNKRSNDSSSNVDLMRESTIDLFRQLSNYNFSKYYYEDESLRKARKSHQAYLPERPSESEAPSTKKGRSFILRRSVRRNDEKRTRQKSFMQSYYQHY